MKSGEQRLFTLYLEILRLVKLHGGQTRELPESDVLRVNRHAPPPNPANPPRVMTSQISHADLSACLWVEVAPHKTCIAKKKMDLPSVLQRQIAMYTPEAGLKLRRGDRFLGNREITHQIRNCICGLCVSTGAQTQTSCTLFDTDDGRVVRRQQTELCRSFCLARNCVSMLQKLIRGLLKKIASRSSVAGDIRLTLQRDGPGQPYIFEVQYFDGELLGSFFIGVDGLGEEEHFRIPYALGADIDFAKILPRPEFKLLKTALERTLIAEDGQAFSLVVIAPELPNQDFEVAGIHFRNEAFGMFRARPLYLFLQATSQ